MYIMDLEAQAIIFLGVGLLFLFLNYLIFKIFVLYTPKTEEVLSTSLQIYHAIFKGLDRIFTIIVLLVTLGFMSSLTTFLFASLTYFNSHNLMSVLQLTPILLIVYLLFMIPSFYGLKEITNVKSLLKNFEQVKTDLRDILQSKKVSSTDKNQHLT